MYNSHSTRSSDIRIPSPGDIVFVDFGDTKVGSELKGKHPSVVVSSFGFNKGTEMCMVCPIVPDTLLKSKAVYLSGRDTQARGYILANQLKTIDFLERREFRILEKVPADILAELRSIVLHFLITSVGHMAGDLCQGDIVYIDFDGSDGREIRKRRPGIVVSNEYLNGRMFLVCPVTSTARGFFGEVSVPDGLPINGVIRCDQIRAMDIADRHFEFKGILPLKETEDVICLVSSFLRE